MAYTIEMYDEIGPSYYGMLDAKWMSDHLTKANGQDITLRINSPGGSVFDAQAMYNAIQRYSGKVTAHVDALAASAASFIMLAADSVHIAENAMVMIHKAGSLTWGNADEMRKVADLLDKVDGILIDQYAAKTKQDKTQIEQWMAAETWMTAQEALDRGFVDSIDQPLAVKACVREGQFTNTPTHLLAPAASVAPRVQAAAIARRLAYARAINS